MQPIILVLFATLLHSKCDCSSKFKNSTEPDKILHRYNLKRTGCREGILEVISEAGETVVLSENRETDITLKEKIQTLQEVMVSDNYAEQRNKEDSLNVEFVNDMCTRP